MHRAREQHFFEGEKVISLRKTRIPSFTYTDFPCYVSQTFFVVQPNDINLKYLAALLNSRLIHFWLYYKGKKQGDQLQIDKEPLLDLPLIKLNNTELENKLVAVVDTIMETNEKLQESRLATEQEQYKNKIQALEKEIDKIFYKIYGLEEEIGVIEQKMYN